MFAPITTFISSSAVMTLLLLASPAGAGGIIVDGKTPTSTESGLLNDDSGEAGDSDQTAEEIYLWASVVFAGHAAAAGLDQDPDDGIDPFMDLDDPFMAEIFQGLEGEPSGGCAATDSGLGVLAIAFLLAIRRKRR